MTDTYDSIVIGVGGMGSAAVCALARRGQRVLGLEQFDLGHQLGSSAAGSRIYRFAYFLDPAYVPLMRHAHAAWARLERDAGQQVLYKTGGLDVSLPTHEVFRGAKAACEHHDLPHEILTAREIMRRHPAWQVSADVQAVYQPDAGYLNAERAIYAHVRVALAQGAEIRCREKVLTFSEAPGRVTVETDRGRYEAESLIITAGPWMGEFVPSLARSLKPERQVVGWYQPRVPADFAPGQFPVFIVGDETGEYFGFPEHDQPGFKLGRHGHRNQVTTPDGIDRHIDAADQAVLDQAIARYFPSAIGQPLALKTCLYTNSPDNHFVIDRLPGHGQTWIAGGFSGHGYKFCAGIGDILADLAIEGRTPEAIDLFAAARLG
jgi:sarcosine oxidase